MKAVSPGTRFPGSYNKTANSWYLPKLFSTEHV